MLCDHGPLVDFDYSALGDDEQNPLNESDGNSIGMDTRKDNDKFDGIFGRGLINAM